MRQITRALAAVAVVGGLSAVAVAQPGPDDLGIVVNFTTGEIRVVGNDADPAEFAGYEIVSASGALNPAGWNSFQDQGFGGFVELGGTDNILAEGTFGAPSVFTSVGRSIGLAFDPMGATDLSFTFLNEQNVVEVGTVQYINIPEPASLGLVAVGGLMALRRRR